jgi:ankyrin repeat protein
LAKDLGADVNLGDEEGCTPLFIAAQKGHLAVLRCLLDELGADVNQASNRGFTPLMIAAE